jgi:hypothetical protein
MGVGDVAYGIAVQAIEGKWTAAQLGPYMARFAIDYANEQAPQPLQTGRDSNDSQIKHMVDRFLAWRLPENFNPDGGISFKKTFNENTPHPMKSEPVGTNLFDASQAEEMIRYMVEGMPADSATRPQRESGLSSTQEHEGYHADETPCYDDMCTGRQPVQQEVFHSKSQEKRIKAQRAAQPTPGSEDYPGQNYFQRHNANIKRAEEDFGEVLHGKSKPS